MLEEYKVRGRSGSLRLKVDAVDPANPTPVDEIKLVKRKKGRSRTGTEETDSRKATIYLTTDDFDDANTDIQPGDIVSYRSERISNTTESIQGFWF